MYLAEVFNIVNGINLKQLLICDSNKGLFTFQTNII